MKLKIELFTKMQKKIQVDSSGHPTHTLANTKILGRLSTQAKKKYYASDSDDAGRDFINNFFPTCTSSDFLSNVRRPMYVKQYLKIA
jgi:hypothetical protein